MSALQIYNSLSRTKETFTPLTEGRVGIYVCGPTVYGHAHLGHAKSYTSFDVVVRWLRHSGCRVKYVQNITDVGHLSDDADEGEDKIGRQARKEKIDPMEVAQFYTRSFYEDMDRLGVERPSIAPLATGHIPEQIALVRQLMEKGHAYEVHGNVYFSVASFPGYGKLSGRTDIEASQSGTRVDVRSEKRDPADFALWKRADEGHIMQWDSPWGRGFPGWHLECSAMSMKYLGETVDIHGGGMENKFPHHDCEIAQSEGATGKPYVRYWMHNNMVTVDGTKMGKSLGNFVTLKELFERFDPLVIRFFILQSHYRSPLDFSEAAIRASATGLEKLRETSRRLEGATAGKAVLDPEPFVRRFTEAMDDDFNTPVAIAVLFDFSKALNAALDAEGIDQPSLEASSAFLKDAAGTVLGILPGGAAAEGGAEGDASRLDGVMELLLEIRAAARKNKDFATSDLIRDRLQEAGIEIKDTREGASWSKKTS
ncbi:cysteine--tRNA ligase [Chlorobium sp. N1]|uniref:cysteine--tRNA ligase n=1 Tax=Chlorobium sp. N1 TaxID=2491138 RepID=UPI00103CC741|nr:cysteine--tRNA ligase [Chlorobium sp. N1]TCD47790.1 cysteine--tRNA ligase [Chlorobium sp. N1]